MDEQYRIRRQQEYDVLRPFTCGDGDLDDFFKNDSLNYSRQKLATSYVVEKDTTLLAYFSIANDRISIENFFGPSAYNKFRRRFVNSKRLRGYPAVKLCRLAVSQSVKGNGLGTEILDFMKGVLYRNQKSACRFLLVDAYRSSINFYLKNGFTPIELTNDYNRDTVPMYFDLADLDIY